MGGVLLNARGQVRHPDAPIEPSKFMGGPLRRAVRTWAETSVAQGADVALSLCKASRSSLVRSSPAVSHSDAASGLTDATTLTRVVLELLHKIAPRAEEIRGVGIW